MHDPHSGSDGAGREAASRFVTTGLLVEGGLGVCGWAVGAWRGIDWMGLLQGGAEGVLWGVVGGLLLVGLHLVFLLPGRERNPLYRNIYRPLVRTLSPHVRGIRTTSLVLLALASGVGEEVLFRGWLQSEVGLLGASLLFGAAHVWGREALPYGLYAAAMGGLLGGLLVATGSLWVPILAHALNNLLGFWALRDRWLGRTVGWGPGDG